MYKKNQEMWSPGFFHAVMKTAVTMEKEERSLHGRYEDLSDKEKGGGKSSSAV
ncbi:hypothetical protein [Sutcliffiella horikoshii]|uniref:hypothetical protein n=1 Tax=Sutcliffiella horikoshii TaxID=79883 RepID=UPI001653A131|nr:hypothetical protein [Sutcliffiella horikoshii]